MRLHMPLNQVGLPLRRDNAMEVTISIRFYATMSAVTMPNMPWSDSA